MPYAYPRQDKTRQDKTRQDKTRQDKTRQTNYGLVALRKVKPKFNFNFSKIPRIVTTLLLIFSLILQNLIFNISPVYAASSPWTQTDWSGGSGQTSWSNVTQYSSGSSVDATTTSGQVTLTNTEKLSNTGFETDLTGWSSSTQTLTLQPDGTVGTDTSIRAETPDTNRNGLGLNIGERASGTVLMRTLIKFDLSSIPSSAIISNTTLSLYADFDGSNNARTFRVYRLKKAWSETGATWNKYDASNNWTTAGGFDSADSEQTDIGNRAFTSTETLNQFKDFSLAPTSKSALDLGNGWIIKADTETDDEYEFVDSENTTAANRPKLVVNYTFANRSTTTTYGGSTGSVQLIPGTNGAGTFTQSVNVGDTNTYNLSAYAYTDGTAVTSADTSLYYNGSTVSTTYTSVGSGWYRLTGTVTGVASSVGAGVQVASGKTVYLDNFSLNNYASSGTLTSSIFDTEITGGAAWGTLTYTSSGSTVAVKARTSNDSGMSGATAFASCTAITSGSDISSNTCVTDGHRYIQYQLALSTSDTSSTPTFSDISIAFATYDADSPSISLTALSPDPNSDNTPTLSGTATDSIGTVSNVQFQMDSTSGSWSNCSASDGSFNSASEAFTCTAATLTDGSHTMYVRATDSNGNTTSSGYASDTFTIDATTPVSIDLDSPGDNSYTNSERPTYKWKATTDATTGLSKYVLEIDNPSIGSSQPSGDFTIDNIPTSGTTDITSNNKYVIHFDGFSDSDATNNYISVYTRSTNDWGSSEHDGKLREGRVSWRVKAVDNAGNEGSSSRTLFVDRTNPNVEFTQINSTPYTSSNFSTTDKTPTIFGKITDPLAGADNDGQTKQDENGPKVASGPKEVNIKIEKKTGLTYTLVTLYKINMDNPYYTCDLGKTIDNSKQKCDKYLPFEYTPKENLDFGTYKITLSGKDKADNNSSEVTLTLNITTLSRITTPAEKQIIEEETKTLKPEEEEQIKQELEITKPTEEVPVSALEKATSVIPDLIGNLYRFSTAWIPTFVGMTRDVFTGIGNGLAFVFDKTGQGLAFIFNKTGEALAFIGNSIGTGINSIAQAIGSGYNNIAYHAPGITKNILLAIGNGFSTTGNFIATTANNIGTGINNGVNGTREGIANIAFGVGERTQDVSDTLGFAFVKFGYLFVNEPTKISDVKELVLSPTSVKITWHTNHPANGKVNYGFKDGDYDFDKQTDKRTTYHEFVIDNLQPNTEYHYEVMSQNKNYVYDANRKFKTPAK